MNPITEYQDYRRYMREFYEERKRNSYFTWREFASLSGFVSPTYLKLVCDGKTRLSKPGVAKVARAMGLEGFDYTFFALLVKFGNAKTDGEKESALQELEREARMNRIRLVDADEVFIVEQQFGHELGAGVAEVAVPGVAVLVPDLDDREVEVVGREDMAIIRPEGRQRELGFA